MRPIPRDTAPTIHVELGCLTLLTNSGLGGVRASAGVESPLG